MRVLLVDDDDDIRTIAKFSLSRLGGFDVMEASGGIQALKAVRKRTPDVILVDMMMPGMDGWEVLRELKADPELAHIPVVMITIVEERELGYSLGAVEYLTKPVNRARLEEMIERFPLEPTSETPSSVDPVPG